MQNMLKNGRHTRRVGIWVNHMLMLRNAFDPSVRLLPLQKYAWAARRLGYLTIGLFLLALCGLIATAHAQAINIVALGASNVNGKGVSTSEAWPAQLAAMLKARGYDVNMTVIASNGLTSSEIAASATSIPAGTKVVIYDTGSVNDARRGVIDAHARNVVAIVSAIRASGATPIENHYWGIPASLRQSDGIHLTPAGNARIAARLLPRVIAAIGKRH